MTTRIALVSCSATKRAGTHAARDLYTSPLFVKSRAWSERFADRWLILSAKHGLVHPDQVLESYDVTLARMPAADERRAWSLSVLFELELELAGTRIELVALAGEAYVGAWRGRLPVPMLEPLRGLQIGERLAWLNRELAR